MAHAPELRGDALARYCLASVLSATVMSPSACSTDFLPFTTSTTGWLKRSFPSASPVHGVLP